MLVVVTYLVRSGSGLASWFVVVLRLELGSRLGHCDPLVLKSVGDGDVPGTVVVLVFRVSVSVSVSARVNVRVRVNALPQPCPQECWWWGRTWHGLVRVRLGQVTV